MNSQTLDPELQAAVNWQVDIQLKELIRMEAFHRQHMNAQGVGPGHQQALQEVYIKKQALERFKANPMLLDESLRASSLKAYQNQLQRQEVLKQKAQEASERARQEQEAKIQQKMLELNRGGFKVNEQAGIPSRTYIRDVNC